jgi:hypothetical protein
MRLETWGLVLFAEQKTVHTDVERVEELMKRVVQANDAGAIHMNVALLQQLHIALPTPTLNSCPYIVLPCRSNKGAVCSAMLYCHSIPVHPMQ